MFRSTLMILSKAGWAQQIITRWKFAWRAASRFVAGDTIQDAIEVVRDLNSSNINVTLDHLGESTATRQDATKATNEILDLLDNIQSFGLRANVSVKLTQIGLQLDAEYCSQNFEKILERAEKYSNFIRIDMEDTSFTDRTIEIYVKMINLGHSLTGVVIQSCLFRSDEDVGKLLSHGARIRLVKGAYKEPPELAFSRKADVDSNFDKLASKMIDSAREHGSIGLSDDGRIPPIAAIATHDQARIQYARRYAEACGLPKEALEFQMLFGIRRDLQSQCVKEGYPVRVYVPYGTHWYQYFMRRLAERPANLWFFISNLIKK
jgi:proline dehydrogenase